MDAPNLPHQTWCCLQVAIVKADWELQGKDEIYQWRILTNIQLVAIRIELVNKLINPSSRRIKMNYKLWIDGKWEDTQGGNVMSIE